MVRSVKRRVPVLLVSAVGSALAALGMWAWFDWTTAWISFAGMFIALNLVALLGRQPRSSRRYRWGGRGLRAACVGMGVVLAIGIPDRTHRELGVAILWGAAFDLWDKRGDRVKPVFYWLFGGPDPVQTNPVRVSRYATASAPSQNTTSSCGVASDPHPQTQVQ